MALEAWERKLNRIIAGAERNVILMVRKCESASESDPLSAFCLTHLEIDTIENTI